ncbi:LPD7 domain-containing protein [Vibrio parahaemolyticus]|uniref:LPD7 domain-containing protein n=1 Tax=Vibrio parahaemolyticus TaxID=670 RepID=UPI00133135AD|nr:LPD7 domain-containing protein [Vibrio parahaemolyticus]
MSFQQYLCLQAANGNEEALTRLRSKAQLSIQHQGLSGQGDKRITQFDSVSVDKRGVLAYQVGDNTILDNGKQLTTKGNSLVADKQLLEMAVAKYGQKLTLHGSDEFQARICEAAENPQHERDLQW